MGKAIRIRELHEIVAKVFHFDTSVLTSFGIKKLEARFIHEVRHDENPTALKCACRAFTWFVKDFGDAKQFGVSDALLLEWIPDEHEFRF